MAKSVTKRRKTVPELSVVKPPAEVLPPKAHRDSVLYTNSIERLRGSRGGRPPLIGTEEELTEEINSYLQSIRDEDDKYFRAPSLTGLGLHLGYHTRSWHEGVAASSPVLSAVLSHYRMWLDEWRTSHMILPTDGVNPAGLMFLMNRRDRQQEVREMKDVTPADQTDNRPVDAVKMIEDMWKKHEGK